MIKMCHIGHEMCSMQRPEDGIFRCWLVLKPVTHIWLAGIYMMNLIGIIHKMI